MRTAATPRPVRRRLVNNSKLEKGMVAGCGVEGRSLCLVRLASQCE